MPLPAIEVSGLSKHYVIEHESRHDNLRDTLHHTARKLWRRVRWGTSFEKEEFWALRDVSFAVQPGEVVGIVGRNGAGKSTLLKILTRITAPTSGKITLRGRVASLLEVGTGFHPDLTGRENIFLNGAILGMQRAEIRRKFDEIVAFAEIERFLDTPVKRYSSGMYVRLAFAVAAHLEPEILIIDEVLAVGDAQFQKKCLGKMRDVAQGEGRTVLFVSHNLGAIRSLCTKCAWLNSGQLVEHGSTEAVINAYYKSGSESTARQRIAEFPRGATLGERLRVTELSFNRGKVVQHGAPFSFVIEYEGRLACTDVSFGVGITNFDGTRLLTFDSDLTLPRIDLPAGAKGRVECTVPELWLQPGLYLVDIGARSGDYSALDYAPGVFQLEVFPGPKTPSTLIRDAGHVRYPGTWHQL